MSFQSLDENIQQFFLTITSPLYFLFTQKTYLNYTVFRIQPILTKVSNLIVVWTAGKRLGLPDTLGRFTSPEPLARKIMLEKSQKKISV